MEMNTLDELERLLKAGTPGPWWIATMAPEYVYAGSREVARCYKLPDTKGALPSDNAALIVAAINALPGLIESVRRVRELEAALAPFAEQADEYDARGGEMAADDEQSDRPTFQVSDFRTARAALEGT